MGRRNRKGGRQGERRRRRIRWAVIGALLGAAATTYIFRDSVWAWFHRYGFQIAGVSATGGLLWGFRRLLDRRLTREILDVDRMSGHEFERYLARLFVRLGYTTRLVGASGGDFGADLIIRKGDVSLAVQAKNYESGKVGNDAVQQAIAGATFYGCEGAMVVTNAYYTPAAEEQARRCTLFPVTLWSRRDLAKVLSDLRKGPLGS